MLAPHSASLSSIFTDGALLLTPLTVMMGGPKWQVAEDMKLIVKVIKSHQAERH